MIRRQVIMPVSPERLWDALTDPDEMVGWFGARVEWHLEPGAPARFHGDDGSERAGRVEVVRPRRHLRFRWWPAGASDPGRGPARPGPGGVGGAGRDGGDGGDRGVGGELRPRAGSRWNPPHHPGTAGAPSPPATIPTAQAQARPGASAGQWTAWDGRLITAWVGLAAPAREGVHV